MRLEMVEGGRMVAVFTFFTLQGVILSRTVRSEKFSLLQHQRSLERSIESETGGLLVDEVNVLAGTQSEESLSRGNTLPLIARPWGFNHWAVQNSGVKNWFFHPDRKDFGGLRCTHQPSPWIGDYGHFVIQPRLHGYSGDLTYSSRSSTFKPYEFKAQLVQGQKTIYFEMVPSMHGALVRVEFPANHAGSLYFEQADSDWKVDDDGLSGIASGTEFGQFRVHVQAPDGPTGNVLSSIDQDGKGVLHFKPAAKGHRWTVRLATSFISTDQAKKNVERELGRKQLEAVRQEAIDEWESLLARVKVQFSESDRTSVFYTNLYRGMLFPRFLWEYNDEDKPVHFSPFSGDVRPGRLVADEGFWDAYRTHYPMLSLIFPDKLGEIIDGWVGTYEEEGWLPTWASPGQKQCMVGTMGDCSLADAIVKSTQGLLSGFNRSLALDAIFKDAFQEPDYATIGKDLGRVGLQDYIKKGYVPSDDADVRRVAGQQTAALTLNYNLADACIALAAEATGNHDEAVTLRSRSRSFKRMFDNSTGYFRPIRKDGKWADHWSDEEAVTWGNGFTEASAAQYRFYAPHDVDGLTQLMGGKERLCKHVHEMLESRFDYRDGSYGYKIHEMSEAEKVGSKGFGLYAHNNQPVHDVLYVAAAAGCRSLAQKTLRHVMSELYTQDGWSGDEDTGEMSSWYILSSLGLYSILPGSDDLIIGSPEVTSAALRVPGRPLLKIKAAGNSKDHVYVRNVKLNGKHINGASVKYSELAKKGGSLDFDMSSCSTDSF